MLRVEQKLAKLRVARSFSNLPRLSKLLRFQRKADTKRKEVLKWGKR